MSKTLERLGDPSVTLYLIDISSFIFRAFYAVRPLTTRKGEPTNAVYGVATMLKRLEEEAKPEFLSVVYDSKGSSLRKEIYPEYKANRSETPDDLIPQFDRIEQLIRAFEIHSIREEGHEADDLIATLTKRWLKLSDAHRVVVVTGDKDLMQLVNDRVQVWDTMAGKIYARDEVIEKFAVNPEQVRDYLALVGDSSDNIPGVPSIGPKSASDLLKEHGTLEGILKAAKSGGVKGKKAEALVNHEADAILSQKLATVHEDIPVQVERDDFKYRFHVTPACVELMRELDFHTLIARWAPDSKTLPTAGVASAPAASQAPAATKAEHSIAASRDFSKTFRCVNTEKDFIDLLGHLDRKKEFGFDLETTSLNPRLAEIVGIAICYDPDHSAYIPVGHKAPRDQQLDPKWVLSKLKPFLEDPRHKKIGQNLKYDFSVLYKFGLKPDGVGADTMVGSYVLEPEGRHNLETLARNYLDYTVLTFEEICGKGAKQIGFDEVPIDVATRYSAEDAWVAVHLWEKIKKKLQEEKLMEVFATVDLPLVNVLARMEAQGVCLDVPFLKNLSKEYETELAAIEKRIHSFAREPINLNSTRQIAQLLFEDLGLPAQAKTKTGYSTDAKVLADIAHLHEVPKLLLEYREISKLKGTYVDPLPELRDPIDGKIHASFHQTVAATGRLSSSDPNLQNIPIKTERGRRIRQAFIPSEGNVLLAADYSQIELRLLAHMSGDKELSRSFIADEDVHRRTASEIYSVNPESVTDLQRNVAKAINFGLMYGKTAFGLSQELGIPRKEAQETIDAYFKRYSGVKHFLDQQVILAKERGYAMTLMGRKRSLKDIDARNPMIRQNAERMAMNSPIQGTAADMMKLAMIEVDEKLIEGGYRSKLTIQVHDELVLDVPKDELEDVQKLVCGIMEGAMKLDVPLRVNAGSGENWSET